MEKTYFITFEGIDGSGKDTQLFKLIEEIKNEKNSIFGNKYSNIWITREPTKITNSGKTIADLIRKRDVSGEEATKYFIQDRIEHSSIIKKQLKHSHVLSSRYDLSTFSYQMSQGQDFEHLYSLHKYGKENGSLIPDLTIVFDLDVETAIQRTLSRNEIQECFEKKQFQIEVKKNLSIAIKKLQEKDNRKIIIINANQPIEKVTCEMIEKISKILK